MWRARSALTKEAGTVAWIRSDVKSGDVFYDIGANIGLYGIMAGKRVGDSGAVYAFEPHAANLQALIANVAGNGLTDQCRVLSCALHDREGFFEFNYQNIRAGSSMSQLGEPFDEEGVAFRPVATEVKYASSVDRLIEQGVLRPPTLVKLDVDGNEVLVLAGMRATLASHRRPRAIQAEINRRNSHDVISLLTASGYQLSERHWSSVGAARIDAGADPSVVTHNAIFRSLQPGTGTS